MKLPSQETRERRATKCIVNVKSILKISDQNQLYRKQKQLTLKNFSDADETLAREPKVRKDPVSKVKHQTQLPHLTKETEKKIKASSVSITIWII